MKSYSEYAKIKDENKLIDLEAYFMNWLNCWIKTSYESDSAISPMHIHSHCELLYIASGSAEMKIGGTGYTITPHSIAVIGALEPHDLVPTSYPYVRIGMHINTSFLESVGIPSTLSSLLNEHAEDFCHVLKLDESNGIEQLAREIYAEYMGRDDMSEKLAAILFHEMLIRLRRLHPESFPTHVKDVEMEEAKRYLDKNFAQNISVNDLAQRFFLTPSHFIVRFKKYTGYTPCRYKGMRKLEKARALLADQRLTLVEIAEMCGYADLNSFVRSFRQAMNVTPGQFRTLSLSKNIEM